jgi:O-antigen/teichoic acid export membrane protein
MATRTSGNLIIENSSWNVGATIAYTALSLLSAPAYLHFLGVNQYGIFVLLTTVIAPLGMLNMGMGQAAVKYIAESLARKQPKEANAYLQGTFLTTGVLGTLGVLAVVLAARVLTTRVFSFNHADQQIAYAGVPWVALTWLLSQLAAQFTAVPSAMQRYSIVSTGTTICGAVTMGMGLMALWLGGNLLTVLEVRTAATFATTLCWGFVAKRLLPSLGLRLTITRATLAKCMHFGVWQSIATAGGMVSSNADKAILGMYLSDVAVGLFAIPQMMVGVTYSLTNKAAEVLLPAVSEIDSTAGRERSFWVTIRVGWILSLITTGAMGCLVIMGNDVLRLYLGRALMASCGSLLALIAITAMGSSSSPALMQYLLGIGDTKRTALIAVCSGVVNVAGALLLVRRFGLNGAAWADLVAIFLVRPMMHLLIWRGSARSVPFVSVASYLYGPAAVGIPLSLALRGVRESFGWQCGWFGLVICCVACCVIMVSIVVLFDRALPEWEQRRSDSIQVLRHVWKVKGHAFRFIAIAAGR